MSIGNDRRSSMKTMKLSPARGAGAALMAGALVVGCVSPDAFFRDGGGLPEGAGGTDFSLGGQTGSGGSGLGGSGAGGKTGVGGAGMGGATGAGGRTGSGGGGMGGTPGAGGGGAGGRSGMGGSGMGGAPGVGGSGVGGMPGAGGTPGLGGIPGAGGTPGTGGVTVTGCPPGIFCDNFEADTVAQMPAAWSRDNSGSSGDWAVRSDTTKVFAQDHTNSTTFRACYSSGAPGAPWSGATTVSAQVKILLAGSSGATTPMICVRYTVGPGPADCLALVPGMGAQIQVRTGQTINASNTFSATQLAVGGSYRARLSIDAAGTLSASVDGVAVGTLTPGTTVASGFVAVATQSAEASFDNIVVSQP